MRIVHSIQALATSKPARRQWLSRGRIGCGILLVVFLLTGTAEPQTAFTSNDVEAAYLYNFGKFIHWPADPNAASSPFSICILGDDPFGGKLDALIANESIQGHPILIQRLPSASAATTCQIVYLGNSEDPRLAKDLAELQKKQILTVSSLPHFLERGGMIQFLVQSNRVRFSVNLVSTEQAGLELSSELLKVAVQVQSKPVQEEKQ
jgi:hypothetical protein